MRFFHLSDLHIGLRLYNRDLYEDQAYVFRQICSLIKTHLPDAIVIAGDIYDKSIPSAEAVTAFDRFLSDLRQAAPQAAIMMISGNHDSSARLNVFRSLLRDEGIYMIGQPPQEEQDHIAKVTLTDSHGPVHFWLLPFVKPSTVKAIVGTDEAGNNLSYDETLRRLIGREPIDRTQRNVLVSHQFYLPVGSDADSIQRADSEIRTVGNIDQVKSDVLLPFDYAALGHIHKPMKVGSEFYRYCGTPIPCSLSEEGQQKQILMVDMEEKGNTQVTSLPLTPLRQVRSVTGYLNEVVLHPSEDYVTVMLKDQEDLDILDMQDRLRNAFPNLLEIRRLRGPQVDYSMELPQGEMPDPFTLITSFLKDPDEKEQEILRDLLNVAMEVKP